MKDIKIFDFLHYSVIHLLCFRLTHTNIPQHNCTCVCAWVCDGIRGETLSPPTKHDASLLYCFTTLITDVIVVVFVDYPRFWPFHWCFLTQPSTAKVKRNTLLLLMFCVLPYRIARTTTNEKVYGWYRPAIMVNGKVQRRTRRSKIENNLCTHTHTHKHIHTYIVGCSTRHCSSVSVSHSVQHVVVVVVWLRFSVRHDGSPFCHFCSWLSRESRVSVCTSLLATFVSAASVTITISWLCYYRVETSTPCCLWYIAILFRDPEIVLTWMSFWWICLLSCTFLQLIINSQ